jgi:glucan biosynthesis protein C
MERTRLLFIDNLRIVLIALVIMVHLSVTYGGEGSWYYKEGKPDTISSVVLTWHNAAGQAFFMGFLFMISGYFTPASYERKGPRRFLIDRLLRLGIPMLFFDYVINPLMGYVLLTSIHKRYDSPWRLLAEYLGGFHIGTGPLWFVETLLIFAGIYVLWRLLAKPPVGQTDGKMPGKMAIAIFAFVAGIVTFVVRIWLPIGWAFAPLNLQFPFFPQYICLFIIGIIAYRRNWFMCIPVAMGKFWLCVAVVFIAVLFPVLFVTGGALEGGVSAFVGGAHWQCFAYAMWEQFFGIAMIVGLLVLFRERFNRQGRLAKAMSASSYTAYIIHAPVIIFLALAMRKIDLYPLVKFALAVLVAVPLCFALANVIRKLPLARRIL